MVSVVAFVVSVMLLPATSVRVSLPLSATTSLCPDTAMVLKVFVTVPLFVIVSVSVLAFVVSVIPVPAAIVSVSIWVSATMEDCPDTAMVSKLFAARVVHERPPAAFVASTCPLVPSAEGRV
jgi:hypothetical protein